MTDDIDKLKQRYRGIGAPPYLATRVRAGVGDEPRPVRTWMPAVTTALVLGAAVSLLPFIMSTLPDEKPRTLKPSLAALASLKPSKPQGKTPSLSSLRSVKVPALPRKPQPSQAKPQSNF